MAMARITFAIVMISLVSSRIRAIFWESVNAAICAAVNQQKTSVFDVHERIVRPGRPGIPQPCVHSDLLVVTLTERLLVFF